MHRWTLPAARKAHGGSESNTSGKWMPCRGRLGWFGQSSLWSEERKRKAGGHSEERARRPVPHLQRAEPNSKDIAYNLFRRTQYPRSCNAIVTRARFIAYRTGSIAATPPSPTGYVPGTAFPA